MYYEKQLSHFSLFKNRYAHLHCLSRPELDTLFLFTTVLNVFKLLSRKFLVTLFLSYWSVLYERLKLIFNRSKHYCNGNLDLADSVYILNLQRRTKGSCGGHVDAGLKAQLLKKILSMNRTIPYGFLLNNKNYELFLFT